MQCDHPAPGHAKSLCAIGNDDWSCSVSVLTGLGTHRRPLDGQETCAGSVEVEVINTTLEQVRDNPRRVVGTQYGIQRCIDAASDCSGLDSVSDPAVRGRTYMCSRARAAVPRPRAACAFGSW